MSGSLQKIVSGGQTGVDRAALDAALAAGLAVGGWCPAGRRAEDGPLDPRYPLAETPADDYAQRTAWNVRDSDATLILVTGAPAGGTALTHAEARQRGKPSLLVDLDAGCAPEAVLGWSVQHRVRVLNVAGPRESEAPGVYGRALAFLRAVFALNARHEGAA